MTTKEISVNGGDFQNIRIFSLILGIYVAFLSVTIAILGYNGSFIFLNSNSYSWLDWPMFIITHLGDSLILSSIISLILIKQRPDTVLNVIIAVAITGILGQILKQTYFDDWDRPLKVFGEAGAIHSLPNYRLFHNTFPSGHSITVTSAFTILILDTRPKKLLQAFFAVIVIIVTYSRIYLSAHFPADVLAGVLIGLFVSWLIFRIVCPYTRRLKYNNAFKISITSIAILSLIAGIWLLKVYFLPVFD